MTDDTLTKEAVAREERNKSWPFIQSKLAEHGVIVQKIQPLFRPVIVQFIETNFQTETQKDEDYWEEIADWVIEEHPSWESKARRRLRHARNVWDEFFGGSTLYEYTGSVESAEELAEHKYAIAARDYDNRQDTVHFADNDHDIAEFVAEQAWSAESEEDIQYIKDLDTGEEYKPNISQVLTVIVNGVEVTRTN
jgi:hypothetical protein